MFYRKVLHDLFVTNIEKLFNNKVITDLRSFEYEKSTSFFLKLN